MMELIRKSREQEGFTLVELVVVIVIIGILAAVAIPLYNSQTAKARLNKAKAQLSSLRTSVEAYRAESDTGALPEAADGAADMDNVAWPTGYTYTPAEDGTYTISVDVDGATWTIDETGTVSSAAAEGEEEE